MYFPHYRGNNLTNGKIETDKYLLVESYIDWRTHILLKIRSKLGGTPLCQFTGS